MAITYDTTSGNTGTGSAQTLTWSHTVTGSSPVLLVSCACDAGAGAATATYNGVSMTLLHTDPTGGAGNRTFYLLNPATGANTVSVDFGSSKSNRAGISVSYVGGKQSGFPDSATYIDYPGSGPSNTQAVSVTSTVNNCWAVGIAYNNNGTSITAGANTTMRTPQESIASSRTFAVGDSNGVITPAGSLTLNYAATSTPNWVVHAFTIAPVVTSNGNFLAFM